MRLSYNDIKEYSEQLHIIARKIENNFEDLKSLGTTLEAKEILVSPASNYYQTKFMSVVKNVDEALYEIESCVLYMAKISDGYKALDEKLLSDICAKLKMVEPTIESSRIFNGL